MDTRLGHANVNTVNSILKLYNSPLSNKAEIPFCKSYCLGKSHKLFSPASLTTHTGFNYYITFVDAFTKFTWIYFLKIKFGALTAFTQFQALIKTQFGATIKAVHNTKGISASPEGRIYITKEVLFDETKMPYPTLFQTTSATTNASSSPSNDTSTLFLPTPSPTTTTPAIPHQNIIIDNSQPPPLTETNPSTTPMLYTPPSQLHTPHTSHTNHHNISSLYHTTTHILLHLSLLPHNHPPLTLFLQNTTWLLDHKLGT